MNLLVPRETEHHRHHQKQQEKKKTSTKRPQQQQTDDNNNVVDGDGNLPNWFQCGVIFDGEDGEEKLRRRQQTKATKMIRNRIESSEWNGMEWKKK